MTDAPVQQPAPAAVATPAPARTVVVEEPRSPRQSTVRRSTARMSADVEGGMPRQSFHGPYHHDHDHENEDYDHEHHHWLEHHGPIHPSKKFTGHQMFYLFALDGFGALFISGGINFAIAYGMYAHQNLEKHPIRLFQLPNTLAGDAGVTLIIQCIVTWLIEVALVNHDLSTGNVQSMGFLPEPKNKWIRWFFLLDEPDVDSETKAQLFKQWFWFLLNQALRGFIIAVIAFPFMWPPTVGILTGVGTKNGGDWDFPQKWSPQLFKLIYGGVLALITTPPMAAFWMLRYGWQENSRLASDAAAAAAASVAGPAGPATGAVRTPSEEGRTLVEEPEPTDEPAPTNDSEAPLRGAKLEEAGLKQDEAGLASEAQTKATSTKAIDDGVAQRS